MTQGLQRERVNNLESIYITQGVYYLTQGFIFTIQSYTTDTEVSNDSIIRSLNKSVIYDRHRGLTSQDQVIPHIGVG